MIFKLVKSEKKKRKNVGCVPPASVEATRCYNWLEGLGNTVPPSLDHVHLEPYPARYHNPWKEHGTRQEFKLYPREHNNKHVQQECIPVGCVPPAH